jgi:CHAT domain-containing protein/tetratricopeptide (TPR) repeat protein
MENAHYAASRCGDSFVSFGLESLGRFVRLLLPAVAIGVLSLGVSAFAQDRRAPNDAYFAKIPMLYDGDYADALKDFQSDMRTSIRWGQSRWIDAICYETMMGECFYQMGALDKALDAYTDALRLYISYPDWMVRVNFHPIRPAGAGFRKAVPWGVSKRPAKLGEYPQTVLITVGNSEDVNEEIYKKRGGVIQQMQQYSICPQEIVRCTTLAIRRRAELLGPLCKNDALTGEIVNKMSGAIGPPNHWSEAWTDLERGLAYLAMGREGQGIPYLQRSVLAAGEYDHPMTCVALFELGRIALQKNDFAGATNYFEEASYSAVTYGDYGILEESLRYAALTHLMANRQGLYPVLQPAVGWAKIKSLRASLLLSWAENLSVMGQTREAGNMLEEARSVIGRRGMAAGRLGGRLSYLNAVVLFQERKTADAQKALADAMQYMKHGSFWLFHINLAEIYYNGTGGNAQGSRLALELYGNLLRDPRPSDWAFDPAEALAVLTTPHYPAFEHWFEAAIQNKANLDLAMEVSDRARRHRFFSSLALGGRLESLRWVLEAPSEWLTSQTSLQRQELLTRYPQYAKLSEQAKQLHAKMAAVPLVKDDKGLFREQATTLNELASVCSQQEALLREMAVRREAADMAFPPVKKIADLKKVLPEGYAVLAFFATSHKLYAFLMNNTKYSGWEIPSSVSLNKQTVSMLRDMSQFSAAGDVSLKDLAEVKWKQSAAKVLDSLTKGSPADFSKPLKELAIVPDGAMWYLPFEALQVTVDGKPQSLISRFRIRYAPTISLSMTPYPPARKAVGSSVAVWGKAPSREEEDSFKTAIEQFESAVPGVVSMRSPAPAASSLYGSILNQLIVFDDLQFDDKDPYNWSPVPFDRGKPGSTIADWLGLPWGRPSEIILTGFHTTAEDSLKRLNKNVLPGNDVFLSVCGMMSTGTRTMLLSRWRTGGQSSIDLVREFAQELPHTSPADAWQRAVQLEMDSRLNPDAEPRVKKAAAGDVPKAEHPFFWAGYMLLDGGVPPEKLLLPTEEPANKANPPADAKPEKPFLPPMPGDKPKADLKPKPGEKAKPGDKPKAGVKNKATEKTKKEEKPQAEENSVEDSNTTEEAEEK